MKRRNNKVKEQNIPLKIKRTKLTDDSEVNNESSVPEAVSNEQIAIQIEAPKKVEEKKVVQEKKITKEKKIIKEQKPEPVMSFNDDPSFVMNIGVESSNQDETETTPDDAFVFDNEEIKKNTVDPATLGKYGSRKHPAPVVTTTPKQRTPAAGLEAPLKKKKSKSIFTGLSFENMNLTPNLVKRIMDSEGLHLSTPTLVQSAAIPVILSGKDAMIKAETGSGKTLAYLIPIVQQLQAITPRLSRDDGTIAIILVPTRELCVQIEDVLKILLKSFYYIVPTVICGGQKRKSEKTRLRKGSHIVITTPGRLLDHMLHTASFTVNKLRYIILDEADRLLDMGFEAQISQLLRILNARAKEGTGNHPQTVLLSATLSNQIKNLADSTLRNQEYIDADKLLKKNPQLKEEQEMVKDKVNQELTDEAFFEMPEQLKQYYFQIELGIKLPMLLSFLRKELRKSESCKILLFVNTCDSVEFLVELLKEYIWPGDGMDTQVCKGVVFGLHGNMPQYQRLENLREFVKSPLATMVCTDVAARGLDIPTVDWVIQYDPPTELTEYVHRCGRTARAGHSGQSVIFLEPLEIGFLTLLQKRNLTISQLNYDSWFRDSVREVEGKGKYTYKSPFKAAADIQAALVQCVEGEEGSINGIRDLAAIGFSSYIRSYATYSKELKTIFSVRALHLGHVAKSFGLKTAPKKIGAKAVAKARKRLTGQIAAKGEGSKYLDFGTTSEKKKKLFEAIKEEKEKKKMQDDRKSNKKERSKFEKQMISKGKKRVREIMNVSEFD
ncbi:hypothetical protein WA158_006522 [Blastocystis sp. Blastoise]